jgi:hypothetical protein
MIVNEQLFLNGAPVVGFGAIDAQQLAQANYEAEKKLFNTAIGIGLAVGAAGGALLGHRVKKGTGTAIGAVAGGLVGGAGVVMLRRPTLQRADDARGGPYGGVQAIASSNPNYGIKYTAQALQVAALPSTQGPVMLCSYMPFATLEAPDLATAQGHLNRLKAEYETPPEDLYGRKGRRRIVRLVKRYFDPKTHVELPSDLLYESAQKFPIPTSPDAGGTVRLNGVPVVGFGDAEFVAPAATEPSPWALALVTSVIGTAAGWALEEVRDRIRGRRR